MTCLFQTGSFRLAGGQESTWKIECDALTEQDWQCLAQMVERRYGFSEVHGVPSGGDKLAYLLQQKAKANPGNKNSLIVDDVYTTGRSIREMRDKLIERPNGGGRRYLGLVVFARSPINDADKWVTPIFQIWR